MNVVFSIAVRSVSPAHGQYKSVLAALVVSIGVVASIAYVFHKLVPIYTHDYNSVIYTQMYCRQLSIRS